MLQKRRPASGEFSLRWTGTHHGVHEQGINALQLVTDRGVVDCRYHPVAVEGSKLGAIWVGGAGGGLKGPARGLYLEACRCLQEQGVAGLRLHYRYPNDLPECVLDTLLGVEFLATEGIERVALVGHSFGGAVVISAGAIAERVRAVVAMSTQTHGTDQAAALSPRALLLVHGSADEVLPAACSRQVFARAAQPKELVLYPGATHGLDTVREELLALLVSWIPEALQRAPSATGNVGAVQQQDMSFLMKGFNGAPSATGNVGCAGKEAFLDQKCASMGPRQRRGMWAARRVARLEERE